MTANIIDATALLDQADEKIAVARAFAVFKAPYFSTLIYGFVFTPSFLIRTMACTKRLILAYSPEWALRGTNAELAADIIHEANHVIRGHFTRGATVGDPELFNWAGDLAINPDLRTAGWKLEDGSFFPEMFGLPEGLSTEEYYDLLTKIDNGGVGGNQALKDQLKKRRQDCLESEGGADGGEGSSSKGACGIGRGACGGVSGNAEGETSSAEQQLNATPGLGRSEVDVKNIERRAAEEIRVYAEQHGRGSVPASLVDWAKTFDDEPHIRWQDELAHVIREQSGRLQSGGDDFSMSRPSKRSYMRGILRPGMVERLPEVAIIRDSSGSMGQKQLTECARESYFIMQALGVDEVWFADADTQISSSWQRVGAEFFRALTEVHGRGGTDFCGPIEEAQRLQPKPDLLVYCTDGDGTAPEEPPSGIAVVWCVVSSYYNRRPAKWGHFVLVTDDPGQRKAASAADIEDADNV